MSPNAAALLWALSRTSIFRPSVFKPFGPSGLKRHWLARCRCRREVWKAVSQRFPTYSFAMWHVPGRGRLPPASVCLVSVCLLCVLVPHLSITSYLGVWFTFAGTMQTPLTAGYWAPLSPPGLVRDWGTQRALTEVPVSFTCKRSVQPPSPGHFSADPLCLWWEHLALRTRTRRWSVAYGCPVHVRSPELMHMARLPLPTLGPTPPHGTLPCLTPLYSLVDCMPLTPFNLLRSPSSRGHHHCVAVRGWPLSGSPVLSALMLNAPAEGWATLSPTANPLALRSPHMCPVAEVHKEPACTRLPGPPQGTKYRLRRLIRITRA